ncbi:hypothetical protein HMPREF9108_01991 [Leptotrichia sp. oral taxon 225 str. F0581]|nr:hypothetical protein HMPREF9108_01991 [Leptotrichia sp. oral taxon 225 str. F0581]
MIFWNENDCLSVSEFRFYFKKMLRRARVAREMATDFPCLYKKKKT